MPVRRTLFLEPSGKREIQIAVRIRVPGGDPRRALNLLADQDHDGKLDPAEIERVRAMLAARALDGVKLFAGTATITVARLESKAEVEGTEGPIEVMLHGVGALPEAPRPLRLSVTTRAGGEEIHLVLLRGTRPVIDASRGEVVRGALQTTLGLGDRVSWRIE